MKNRGFTLLELIIAMAIGALVLVVIQTTYFAALRLHNTTHDRLTQSSALDQALATIRRDLSGVVLPGGTLSGQFQTENFSSLTTDSYGDRVGPDLFTNTGRIEPYSPFSDVQMVTYYLGPADSTPGQALNSVAGSVLRRVVTRNLLPVQDTEPEEQVLLEGVSSATMTFYDGTEWTDTWDSMVTSTLPRAVKFSLVMAPRDPSQPTPDPVELIVPLVVRTVTGQREEDQEAAGSQ